jgi:AraC-like DNA-binding protein
LIYRWNSTIAPGAVRDEQAEQPVLLAGEGLWVCLVSSGACTVVPGESEALGPRGTHSALTAKAGMLALGRGPLRLEPTEPGRTCHLLAVQLTGSAAADFLAGLPTNPFLARGETCPAAAELLGELAAEEAPEHGEASRKQSQLAFALLCELAGADSAAPALPPLVAEAIEDIRHNYAGLYGVEELSERLGVSKSHLVRTFTAAIGVPPGKYLVRVRIEAAMRLLLHREYSLEVIASLCGFSGANYLCRVFKKETGQTPAQWRALAARTGVAGLSPDESRREQELYV